MEIKTHNAQLDFLEKKVKEASSVEERSLLNSIKNSVYDSKSHITGSNNMVRVEMNHDRYVRYMQLVVNPDIDQ